VTVRGEVDNNCVCVIREDWHSWRCVGASSARCAALRDTTTMHNNRTLCAVLLRVKLKRVGLLLHNVKWALVDGRRVEPGTRIAYEHAYSTHAEV